MMFIEHWRVNEYKYKRRNGYAYRRTGYAYTRISSNKGQVYMGQQPYLKIFLFLYKEYKLLKGDLFEGEFIR